MKKELKAWRHKHGLTQTKAAAALDVPIKTYERWEQGVHLPQGVNLAKVLKKLDLPGFEPLAGRRIAQWRLTEHLTQRRAAARLRISQSFLAKLEQDKQRCPAAVLKRLKAIA